MNYSSQRAVVDAFYRAYISRDAEQIGAMLEDDVEWHVAGPVEVMQVCGHWHGKAAVVDRFARVVPLAIDFKNLEIESLLVDGDRSAMFGRVTCVHRESNRSICHRVAHLVEYRNGKAISFRCINDSLDAVEQFVGRHINFGDVAVPTCGDLIAV